MVLLSFPYTYKVSRLAFAQFSLIHMTQKHMLSSENLCQQCLDQIRSNDLQIQYAEK